MASYGADLWPISPQVGSSGIGRFSMYADTYGVFKFPRGYYSMESPPMKFPARELHRAALLRNYTRVGGNGAARAHWFRVESVTPESATRPPPRPRWQSPYLSDNGFANAPFGYFWTHLRYKFDKCINSGGDRIWLV